MLTWKVKWFDCNQQLIVDYNVLKYKVDFIKRLKKICANKDEFSERLKSHMRWQYWGRSEHELVISITDNKVFLIPWSGCKDSENTKIEVIDENFDWYSFADYHIDRQLYSSEPKIDVFDQLQWRWDAFVDYCWYTRVPYQRDHEKFHINT